MSDYFPETNDDTTFQPRLRRSDISSNEVSADKITGGVISAATINIGTGSGNALLKLDGANTRILLSDITTNRVWLDGLTGKMKISMANNDVLTAANTYLLFSTDFGFLVESHYTLTAGNFFTNSTSFVYVVGDVAPVPILITLSDYRNCLFYFEAVTICQTPAGDGNYAEMDLYNLTTLTSVANSTIDGTSDGKATRVRSPALTLTSGANEYAARMKRIGGSGTDYPSCYEAHLVVRVAI